MTSAMSEHVLWRAFDAPSTVGLWDGGYLRTFGFRGPDITSASQAERLQLCERLSEVVRLRDDRWSWLIEAQNVRVTGYPRAQWPTTASALLDAERASQCNRLGAQYEMRHFLTLTQTAPSRVGNGFSRMFTSGESRAAKDRQRDGFRRSCDDMAHVLRGVVELDELDDDGIATYLHSTISTQKHRVRAEDHEILSESLGGERLVRGIGLSRLGGHYMAVLTLAGFPRAARPQMLASLGKLPFEFRWTTRWLPMHRTEAKRLMAKSELQALGGAEYFKDVAFRMFERATSASGESSGPQRRDREALKLAEEAGAATERLGDRGFGHLSATFVVTHPDKIQCIENVGQLKAALQLNDLVVREEALEPVKPWRMTLPGNRQVGRRCFPLNSRNLADLMQTSSVWQGRAYDAKLAETGVKRSWMYTSDPVPFRINTDVPGGCAHTLLLGAPGQAGKSTLANHLALQFFGWPNAQVISLSVGRSELGPVYLSGGAVYRLGTAGSLAFQPLAFVDEPEEFTAALEWLQLCLESLGEAVTPRRTEALTEQLKLLSTDERSLRTMTSLVGMLRTRDPEMALALKVYTHQGAYGHMFDGNDAEALKRHRWTMFDVSGIIGDEVRPAAKIPAIAHLLHRVTRWFDGRPTLLQLDEFPQWLHHDNLQRFVIRVLDTRRKDNVRALMVAQTPGQIVAHQRLLASVQSGCATKFYGPEANALTMAKDYAAMGLSQVETERLPTMPLGSFLLKNLHGSRVFAYKPGPIGLALTGMSTPDELELLERLQAQCSGPDAVLEALMKHAGLYEKARKLVPWKSQVAEFAVAAE